MLTLLKEYVLLTHALQTRSLKKMEHAWNAATLLILIQTKESVLQTLV
jgi:hypothetical protein